MDNKELLDILLSRLDKLESKMDIIAVDNGKKEVTLHNQHLSLQEHIRRTEALESIVMRVVKHTNWVEGVIKAIGLSSLIIGIYATVYKLFW